MRALFVGRFQPFHKGHEAAIKSLLKKFDKVIIAIGSTNKKDKENPFSFNERKKIINSIFSKYKKKYKLIGIPDIVSDSSWAKNIMKKESFDVVVTGNSWTKKCFEKTGKRIIKQKLIKPKAYNATKIRKLIRKNKNWRKLVPRKTIAIIEKSLP